MSIRLQTKNYCMEKIMDKIAFQLAKLHLNSLLFQIGLWLLSQK